MLKPTEDFKSFLLGLLYIFITLANFYVAMFISDFIERFVYRDIVIKLSLFTLYTLFITWIVKITFKNYFKVFPLIIIYLAVSFYGYIMILASNIEF